MSAVPAAVFRRAYQTWGRRWRYTTVATPLLPNVNLVVAAVDDARHYLFDFSAAPEILAGLTIASATLVGGTNPPAAPLTIGTPTVLTAATAGVAAGQGVLVPISGGTAGTLYGLACVAVLTSGDVVVIPAQLSVVTDY